MLFLSVPKILSLGRFLWLSPNYREIFYRIISGDSMQEQKQEYMRRALALAQRGAGHVNPNPMVGCVIVRTEKSSVKAGTSTSAACMPSAMHSRTAPRTARAQTFTSRSSRAATGDARRRAQTQSSSTRSAACSSAASTEPAGSRQRRTDPARRRHRSRDRRVRGRNAAA